MNILCKFLHGYTAQALVLLFSFVLFGRLDAAPLSTSITLANTNTSQSQYVKGGVPFPLGVLTSIDDLVLLNGSTEVPAQYNILSSWPDGSLKSVLVSTITKPNTKHTYSLEYGAGAAREDYPSSLLVNDTSTAIQVNTGLLSFTVSKSGFNLFDGVWRDKNGDGVFSDQEKILGLGEIFLVDAFDGDTYSSKQGSVKSVVVEESGNMRVVIRAEGSLGNTSGGNLTDYIIRIYAYNGLDQLHIDYTLVDKRPEANVQTKRSNLALSVSSYGIKFDHLVSGGKYSFGGDNGSAISGNVSAEHYILQTGEMNYVNGALNSSDPFGISFTGAAAGSRAAGWMKVHNGQQSVAVMVKDFWQQFPNELSLDNNQLKISLHPARSTANPDLSYPDLGSTNQRYERPNTFYFPREGGAKTYRIALDFHDGSESLARMQDLNAYFNRHSPELLATADWYANSKVFGEFSPSSSLTQNYDDYLMNSVYVPSMKEGKNAVMYGWRDYGDRLYAGWELVVDGTRIPGFYNDTHVGANNFYLQFLRTQDLRWWDLASKATYHFMDIDVSHTERYGYHKANGVYYTSPAGEVHVIKHSNIDHSVRNIHLGHSHVSGLTNMYLLTGDKRSYEVLMEIAGFWEVMAPKLFPTPRPKTFVSKNRAYAEAERDFAWPLYVMNEIARVNSKPSYHRDTAGQLVKHFLEWWQEPGQHIISGTNYGTNNALNGTGWWEMDDMDNGSGTGTNPWMAGAALSAVINFYEADLLYQNSGIDHKVLKDMLWQTMNYVVANGYNSTGKYFRYVEGSNSDGGANHIVYSLSYLYRLLQSDIKAGQVSNAQWYTTSNSWLTIASDYYSKFKNSGSLGEGTQSYGFYGYEIVYPMDYFKIIAELTGDTGVPVIPEPDPAPVSPPGPPLNLGVDIIPPSN